MAKQASRDFPLSEANCVDTTNTATKGFKRGIFRHNRIKQAMIHTYNCLQKTRKKSKKKKERSLKEMGRFQRLTRSVPKETDRLSRTVAISARSDHSPRTECQGAKWQWYPAAKPLHHRTRHLIVLLFELIFFCRPCFSDLDTLNTHGCFLCHSSVSCSIAIAFCIFSPIKVGSSCLMHLLNHRAAQLIGP